MWVSTAMAGMPREKLSTIPADFGPMPGSCRSQALASFKGISRRNDRSSEPFSSRTRFKTSLMRGALILASPPGAMAISMSVISAEATSSRVTKRSIRRRYARLELMSEVCWERMVKTISSVGGRRGSWENGPYCAVIISMVRAISALLLVLGALLLTLGLGTVFIR